MARTNRTNKTLQRIFKLKAVNNNNINNNNNHNHDDKTKLQKLFLAKIARENSFHNKIHSNGFVKGFFIVVTFVHLIELNVEAHISSV